MNGMILKSKGGSYGIKNFIDGHLYPLVIFLIDDFWVFGDVYVKWVYSDQIGTGGNMTCLDKLDNGMIEVSLEPGLEYPHVCHITPENFIQLIQQWEILCDKKRLSEVILYEKDKKFILAPYEYQA